MTPRQYWKLYNDHDPDRIKRVCKKAKTSVENFKQIALWDGAVGKGMAKRLSEASGGEMSILEILYPEDYADQSAA